MSIVIRRDFFRLLLVLAALCISAAATAGRGGGWFHGGGYGGVNHNGNWSGGYHGGYYGGGRYRGGYYHGGYHGWYRGGYYRGWYGCCGSVSVGFYYGPGFIYGYPFYPYYYAPYYTSVYYPYVSGDPSQPTQYIEPGPVQAGGADTDDDQGSDAPQLAFWYYCDKPQGYYPYVRTCPSGWQKVPARPPDS